MTCITNEKDIGRLTKAAMLFFMFLPILTISWNLDNDSWFLFAHGRYIINNGFPHIEPFTIHDGLEFVMQQWLSAVIYWVIYSSFGKWMLIALMHILGCAVIWIMYRLCMVLSDGKLYLSVLVTIGAALPVCLWFIVVRPQVFTYIILLLELLCLEKYTKTSDWRKLIVLPLLSVLEINLHSSMWFLMFAFIAPYIIDGFKFKIFFIKSEGYKKLPIIATALLMLAAGLINPYGIDSMTYVFRSYGSELINNNVSEMGVPNIASFEGIVVFSLVFIAALSYVLNKSGKTTLRHFLLMTGTLYLALSALKSLPYFIIGAVLPLAYLLKNQADKLTLGKKEYLKKTSFSILGISCAVVCAAVIICVQDYRSDNDYRCNKNAIEWISDKCDTENVILYTGYADGAYAEYMGLRVYIDPRAEVFLKENNKRFDYFSEYISLQSGDIYYKDFLDKYNFTHILASQEDILYTYLERDDAYISVYEDDGCIIYVPRIGVA